jgi:hypothetical protein
MCKNITCPTCKGSGKQTITVTYIGSDEASSTSEINCVDCEGVGKVDQETIEAIEYEKNMWCKCGNPSGDATYHPDGERGAIVHKHHWTCNDCNKVYQLG